MSGQNFSNATPAAPAGRLNIQWQGDAGNPRNISASIPAPFFVITWGFGIGAPAAVGTDLTSHYLVPAAGTPATLTIAAKTAPAGSDLVLDIQRTPAAGGSAASIFTSPVHLPAGQLQASVVTFAAGLQFTAGDVLSLNCNQVGSSTPGQDILLQLLVTILG